MKSSGGGISSGDHVIPKQDQEVNNTKAHLGMTLRVNLSCSRINNHLVSQVREGRSLAKSSGDGLGGGGYISPMVVVLVLVRLVLTVVDLVKVVLEQGPVPSILPPSQDSPKKFEK